MEPAKNITLMLRNKRLAFTDLAHARSIKGGKPVYGCRIIIDPEDPDVAVIDEAIKAVSAYTFGKTAEGSLKTIITKGRSAFSKTDYTNSMGEVYSGFEGKFSLGASAPEFDKKGRSKKPLLLDKFGQEIPLEKQAETLYAGCYAHFKVEIYVLLRDDGNRISCEVQGVMFAGDGERFINTAPRTSAADFSQFAAPLPDAEDLF
jgi:hypothetical protein